MFYFVNILFLFLSCNANYDVPDKVKKDMLYKINKVRSKGCTCGQRYYGPAQAVQWNETLYKSALLHAKDMKRNNFFGHYSSKGLNIGQRIDRVGYNWHHVGENLGEGQVTFDEVLKDWIASPTHCEMLMNPNVNEMAVAKFDKYWVQHFGSQLPKGAVRN